jgi:hypothetical protein
MKWLIWVFHAVVLTGGLTRVVHGDGYFQSHQNVADGQLIAGLVTFCNGVSIGNTPSSKVIFDTVGLVDGPIACAYDAVNTATLVLANDLKLGGRAVFTTPTNIQGNGHSLLMTGDVALHNRLAVQGGLTINGQGNTLELGSGGFFDLVCVDDTRGLVTTSTLRLRNMTLVVNVENSVRNSYFPCGAVKNFEAEVENFRPMPTSLANIGTLELENVQVVLRNNLWLYGYFSLARRVAVHGQGYQCAIAPYVPCQGVAAGSLFYVGPQVEFVYRGRDRTLFPCDVSSMMWFDGCKIAVVGGSDCDARSMSSGWQLQRGTVLFENNIKIKNCVGLENDEPITDAERSFEFGNDGVSLEANLVVWPNAQLDVTGYLYHNPL